MNELDAIRNGQDVRERQKLIEREATSNKADELIKKTVHAVTAKAKLEANDNARQIVKLQKELAGYQGALENLKDNAKLYYECSIRIDRLTADVNKLENA